MEEECGLKKHSTPQFSKNEDKHYIYIYIFLSQNFIKIKHNREMVGKTCPNMKLTPI